MRRRSEASPMADRRVILSLGAGVQSTTLALMTARGDLSPGFPQPTAAVFADTGWEPASVYRHLRWLIAGGWFNPTHPHRARDAP
jgi:hypothetical protein